LLLFVGEYPKTLAIAFAFSASSFALASSIYLTLFSSILFYSWINDSSESTISILTFILFSHSIFSATFFMNPGGRLTSILSDGLIP
jgi:hypothetical protein